MLWVKSLHIIFMVTWFAGLFYLPRLFVYHAQCNDTPGHERFKIMERKLYYGIMTPGAVLTIALGIWLLVDYAWVQFSGMAWLHIKIMLGIILVIYHIFCAKLINDFRDGQNQHGHVFYRWFNEIPVVFLFVMIFLVIIKPNWTI